jgi:hypothetical protein
MIDFNDSVQQPAQLIDVATDADSEIRLAPGQTLTLAPVGKQTDGATDNEAGDYVSVAFGGDAVVADMTAGRKMILWSALGGKGDIDTKAVKVSDASATAPGYAVVKLRAVGHSAKVQAIVS